jgi:hypothetical protein
VSSQPVTAVVAGGPIAFASIRDVCGGERLQQEWCAVTERNATPQIFI